MKHLAYAVLFLVAVLAPAGGAIHAQVLLNETFVRALDNGGLTFRDTQLNGYATAPITDNDHMNYELAVRRENPQLEIRYAIRTFDPSPREASVRPEAMAEPMFQVVNLNIACKESDILNTVVFAPADVKNEFNADWGATSFVIPKREFAGGFDRCLVVYIYKKRVGAFIFYLFDNRAQEAALRELNGVYYALRFR